MSTVIRSITIICSTSGRYFIYLFLWSFGILFNRKKINRPFPICDCKQNWILIRLVNSSEQSCMRIKYFIHGYGLLLKWCNIMKYKYVLIFSEFIPKFFQYNYNVRNELNKMCVLLLSITNFTMNIVMRCTSLQTRFYQLYVYLRIYNNWRKFIGADIIWKLKRLLGMCTYWYKKIKNNLQVNTDINEDLKCWI